MRFIVLINLLMMLIPTTSADEITTGNLLPNAGQGASSAQSVDNSIDKIGNSFKAKLDMGEAASGVYLVRVGGQYTKSFKTARIIVK